MKGPPKKLSIDGFCGNGRVDSEVPEKSKYGRERRVGGDKSCGPEKY